MLGIEGSRATSSIEPWLKAVCIILRLSGYDGRLIIHF